MKKKILIAIIIIAALLLIPQESKEFRVRVVAASNTDADQDLKYQVVGVLKQEIKKLNQDDIISEIKSNIDLLDKKIAAVLGDRRYSISITKTHFPAKEINGQIIPGGRYRTLLIVIEDGKGKNWWSLLYPAYHNLAFEDLESGDVEYGFYLLERLKKLFDA
jgi:stage II sporulation protein R